MAEAGSSSQVALGFPVPTPVMSIVEGPPETPERERTVPQVSRHQSEIPGGLTPLRTWRKVICREQMRANHYFILQNSNITRAVIFRLFTNVRSNQRMC